MPPVAAVAHRSSEPRLSSARGGGWRTAVPRPSSRWRASVVVVFARSCCRVVAWHGYLTMTPLPVPVPAVSPPEGGLGVGVCMYVYTAYSAIDVDIHIAHQVCAVKNLDSPFLDI